MKTASALEASCLVTSLLVFASRADEPQQRSTKLFFYSCLKGKRVRREHFHASGCFYVPPALRSLPKTKLDASENIFRNGTREEKYFHVVFAKSLRFFNKMLKKSGKTGLCCGAEL